MTDRPPSKNIKKAVFITCNDGYVTRAIVSLKNFQHHNSGYSAYILGTTFSAQSVRLALRYQTGLLRCNLSKDFDNLHKRPYGKEYPIECFYHFYAYKLLRQFDVLVNIEADMYTCAPLQFDVSKVRYVGGAHQLGFTIGSFGQLLFNRLRPIHPKARVPLSNPRIMGGFRVYNTRNLTKIGFYETIVKYYKLARKYKNPRCGDDTLTVMYQGFHPKHFQLFSPWHNVVTDRPVVAIHNVVIIHFTGSDKPWNPTPAAKASPFRRHFLAMWKRFLYNHFPLGFIASHFPKLYVDVTKVRIPFYFYSGIDNFGDQITPYFLKKYGVPGSYTFCQDGHPGRRVISCGSIMRLCNPNTLVYGSGIRDRKQKIRGGAIQIIRGPRTRKRLLEIGCMCPPVYGDPALVLPLYYKPRVDARFVLGIIPHHSQHSRVLNMYKGSKGVLVIDLKTKDVETVVRQILSCRAVVSSSLHGLIVSDAYKVPNKWVKFDDNITGDDTKYYDYFESVHRQDVGFVDCRKYRKAKVCDLKAAARPVRLAFDVARLKEDLFFDERGITNYTKYLFTRLVVSRSHPPPKKTSNRQVSGRGRVIARSRVLANRQVSGRGRVIARSRVLANRKAPPHPKLPARMWFAYRSHFRIRGSLITARVDTWIKKRTCGSKDLPARSKRRVKLGSSFFLVRDKTRCSAHVLLELQVMGKGRI